MGYYQGRSCFFFFSKVELTPRIDKILQPDFVQYKKAFVGGKHLFIITPGLNCKFLITRWCFHTYHMHYRMSNFKERKENGMTCFTKEDSFKWPGFLLRKEKGQKLGTSVSCRNWTDDVRIAEHLERTYGSEELCLVIAGARVIHFSQQRRNYPFVSLKNKISKTKQNKVKQWVLSLEKAYCRLETQVS